MAERSYCMEARPLIVIGRLHLFAQALHLDEDGVDIDVLLGRTFLQAGRGRRQERLLFSD